MVAITTAARASRATLPVRRPGRAQANADPRQEHCGEERTGDGAESVTRLARGRTHARAREPEQPTRGYCPEQAIETPRENQASARSKPTCYTAAKSPVNPVATAVTGYPSPGEPTESMGLVGHLADAERCKPHQSVAEPLSKAECARRGMERCGDERRQDCRGDLVAGIGERLEVATATTPVPNHDWSLPQFAMVTDPTAAARSRDRARRAS